MFMKLRKEMLEVLGVRINCCSSYGIVTGLGRDKKIEVIMYR